MEGKENRRQHYQVQAARSTGTEEGKLRALPRGGGAATSIGVVEADAKGRATADLSRVGDTELGRPSSHNEEGGIEDGG